MRWNEILMESVKKYLPMFGSLIALAIEEERDATTRYFSNIIKRTEEALVREDRVIWALRWERMNAAEGYATAADHPYPGQSEKQQAHHREVREQAQKLLNKYCAELGMTPDMASKAYELYFQGNNNKWKHFARHPAQPLQQYIWNRQKPHELNNALVAIEVEWNKRQSQLIKYGRDEDDDEGGDFSLFLDLSHMEGWENWAWYDLEVASCDREAKAMGHCGNGGGDYGDTILSLRKKMGKGVYRPSLTFILDKNQMLGEMKGRENNKPNAKYHPAIIALLMDDRIRGIKGGGYEPLNNFEMKDLPEQTKLEIQAANPLMRDIPELYDYFVEHREEWAESDPELYNIVADRLREGIKDDIESRYDSQTAKVNLEKGYVTVHSYRDLDSYLSDNQSFIHTLQRVFDEHLPHAIHRDKRMGWLRAESIAQAAKQDLFKEMSEELLAADQNYKINRAGDGSDEMQAVKTEDGSIEIQMPIALWFEVFWGEHSADHRRNMEYIDDVANDWDKDRIGYIIDEDRDAIPSIHVKNLLIEYLMACAGAADRTQQYKTVKWPPIGHELVDAVTKVYGHLDRQSFTDKDEHGHQSEFDFETGGRKPAANGWNWI